MLYAAHGHQIRRCNPKRSPGGFGQITITRFKLGIGELPKMRIDNGLRPLPNEKPAVAREEERGEAALKQDDPFAITGQQMDLAQFAGPAFGSQRAALTLRIARRANQRAQFHQCLVQFPAGPEW